MQTMTIITADANDAIAGARFSALVRFDPIGA